MIFDAIFMPNFTLIRVISLTSTMTFDKSLNHLSIEFHPTNILPFLIAFPQGLLYSPVSKLKKKKFPTMSENCLVLVSTIDLEENYRNF